MLLFSREAVTTTWTIWKCCSMCDLTDIAKRAKGRQIGPCVAVTALTWPTWTHPNTDFILYEVTIPLLFKALLFVSFFNSQNMLSDTIKEIRIHYPKSVLEIWNYHDFPSKQFSKWIQRSHHWDPNLLPRRSMKEIPQSTEQKHKEL